MTTAIILAGGFGTRLRAAVPDLPKPMAPVRGRPFLAHQMDYWIQQGIERFILSVGYRHQIIMDYFGSTWRDIPVDYAVEETPLGTGGGLLMAASGLSESFLVLNGDTFFAASLDALRDFHARNASEWTFCLFRTEEAGRYLGMQVSDDGRILALKSGVSRLANGGAYWLDPGVLAGLKWKAGQACSLENHILPLLMQRKRKFHGLEQSGLFIDIGVPQDYYQAADLLP